MKRFLTFFVALGLLSGMVACDKIKENRKKAPVIDTQKGGNDGGGNQ